MRHRGRDRPFHTAFQNRIGLRKGLAPTTARTIERLARENVSSLLVVPVSFVTDHLQTSYGLDIALREHAETVGIHHYEVTSGLNTHPLFIEALSEATIAQLALPVDVNQLRIGGDGIAQEYPLRPLQELPRHAPPTDRCPSCDSPVGARRWTVAEGVTGSEVQRPGKGEVSPSSAEQ
jgi:ferrochelatase